MNSILVFTLDSAVVGTFASVVLALRSTSCYEWHCCCVKWTDITHRLFECECWVSWIGFGFRFILFALLPNRFSLNFKLFGMVTSVMFLIIFDPLGSGLLPFVSCLFASHSYNCMILVWFFWVKGTYSRGESWHHTHINVCTNQTKTQVSIKTVVRYKYLMIKNCYSMYIEEDCSNFLSA